MMAGSFFIVLLFLSGCQKKDTLSAPLLSDYLPIAKGKFIRYLDSLNYAGNKWTEGVTRYFAELHQVEQGTTLDLTT